MKTSTSTPQNVKNLTAKEKRYFSIMKGQKGVLYLKGKPGTAKTAIIESIAEKLGYQYLDLRLTLMDESEIGLMPIVDKGKGTFRFAVPEWAVKANQGPTIIAVEEFNRATTAHRNACMQIFNERRIGSSFKFNPDVYFVATGNLGDADGTQTEELDSAHKTRMIPFLHDITIQEWIDGYAGENVISEIINFVKAYPSYFYEDAALKKIDEIDTFANPRSWDFLSNFIKTNFEGESADKWIDEVQIIAPAFIGAAAHKFCQYVRDTMQITLKDILGAKKIETVREHTQKMAREKKAELIGEVLAQVKLDESQAPQWPFTPRQTANLMEFMMNSDKDEVVSIGLAILGSDKAIQAVKASRKWNNDAVERFKELMANIK